MPLDETAKKHALRMIPYGLYVVGVREAKADPEALRADPSLHQANLNAFIGSWVSQTSFKPPLVMVGVKGDSRSHHMILEAGVFTLNVLGEGQKDTAARFFKDVTWKDGVANGVPYTVGENGCPQFPDMPASIECRVVHHWVGGDHTVFVAEVTGATYRKEGAKALTHAETGWHYGG
ncbi:MAG TPA: flavin reductase family protein [Candidatus Thermoplasmatota archaeon]|nr:flavin reductase family protein [Candidatus Thermoplasmatota archaeon]